MATIVQGKGSIPQLRERQTAGSGGWVHVGTRGGGGGKPRCLERRSEVRASEGAAPQPEFQTRRRTAPTTTASSAAGSTKDLRRQWSRAVHTLYSAGGTFPKFAIQSRDLHGLL